MFLSPGARARPGSEAPGRLNAPRGTQMLFVQATAPVGWTKLTTNNDKALRIVSGTPGTGGSVPFSTAFASQTPTGSVSTPTGSITVNNHTLTVAEMPSHTHTVNNAGVIDTGGGGPEGTSSANQVEFVFPATISLNNTGGDGGHSHTGSFTGNAVTFTGNAINLAVQFVDAIIARKN